MSILTFAFTIEQELNAFELVEELGMGLKMTIDYRFGFYGEDEQHSILTAKEIKLYKR